MNELVAGAGTPVCEGCQKPIPGQGSTRGRPRKWCGRGCQSKAYRRGRAKEWEQLEAAAKAARVENPSNAPDEDTVEDPDPALDLDLDDDGEDDEDDLDVGEPGEGAPPQERVEFYADQVAVFARLYLRQLEEGTEPDRATRLLTYHAARNVALMFEAARQARAQLLPRHSDDAWARQLQELEEFAQSVAWKDEAGLPDMHLAQQTSSAEPGPDTVPPVDPALRLGRPDLAIPLTVPGLWQSWDVAGWKKHPAIVQVRHRMLVAGRAELVGTRWLAVGGNRYLRERGGGRSHRLRWFDSAQDAAVAVARRHQDVWTRRDASGG